jgi:hypothetical protein
MDFQSGFQMAVQKPDYFFGFQMVVKSWQPKMVWYWGGQFQLKLSI